MKLLSNKLILSFLLILALSCFASCTSSQSDDTQKITILDPAPIISVIEDIHVTDGKLSITPIIENLPELKGHPHWTKDYGHDDVVVHPETGHVTWDIPSDMPNESFHVGLKASASTGSVFLSFIVHVGVPKDKVITVGVGAEYSSIKDGLKNLQSGGTMIVLDGEYAGDENLMGLTLPGSLQHPPSGSENAFTTIMAKSPGQTVLKDGAHIRLNGKWPVSYVAFKGLYVKGSDIAVYGYGDKKGSDERRHHHIKFIRNGADGGDDRSPFTAFRSDDILFENNYVMGGGRYKFSSYQSDGVVWRRNVARYDRGPTAGEPKGTYSVYSTMNAFLGNNLAVDGDSPDFVTEGELAGEFTSPTTGGDTRARFQRNMQINSAFLFGNLDDQRSNGSGGDSDVVHTDVVSWDVRPANRYVMTWGSGWLNHMTMGEVAPREFADEFFNGYHNNTRGITNSILHNFKNGDMFYSLQKESDHMTIDRMVDRYGADTLNITGFTNDLDPDNNSDIDNITEMNPMYSEENVAGALRYLTRIEKGSVLSGQANDGADIGATVMTFVGKTGTFYGEDGYDTETGIAMWPFPMESLIKKKFSEYTYTGPTYEGHYNNRVETGVGTLKGARGFATPGQSLTNYIWGYLGDVVPPFNVTASVDGASVFLQWDAGPQESQEKVTGYNIYFVSDVDDSKVLIENLPGNEFSILIDELSPGETYQVIVSAMEGERESGFSYPVFFSI